MQIRIARPSDAAALLEIYHPHIISSACTFETGVPSPEQFQTRIENGLQKFPWIVCEFEGILAGYVYASTHREREAYQWTCECSVMFMKNSGVKELPGSCMVFFSGSWNCRG